MTQVLCLVMLSLTEREKLGKQAVWKIRSYIFQTCSPYETTEHPAKNALRICEARDWEEN